MAKGARRSATLTHQEFTDALRHALGVDPLYERKWIADGMNSRRGEWGGRGAAVGGAPERDEMIRFMPRVVTMPGLPARKYASAD